MKPAKSAALVVAALLAGVPAPAADLSSGHPVVVELFTSQGCSSCPAADRLLVTLGELSGASVVALAFHVDTWNYIGWTDPFSSAQWSRRQDVYARALVRDSYTPQAVVDGAATMVGSDLSALRAAIAEAAARPAGTITLSLAAAATQILATAQVEVPPSLRDRRLDLMLAVYETGLETPVRRGENGGKVLKNDYVVRILHRAGRLAPAGPSSTRHEAGLPIAKEWQRARLGVAVFLQDPRTLSIHGAQAVALADVP